MKTQVCVCGRVWK